MRSRVLGALACLLLAVPALVSEHGLEPQAAHAAQPNIAGVTTLVGECASASLSDTSATVMLNNAAASGLVLKVNLIVVANDDGANPADITVSLNSEDDGGGTAVKLAHTVTVPAKASLTVLRGGPLYLEEDRSLVATASAGNDLDVTVCYEEITDV